MNLSKTQAKKVVELAVFECLTSSTLTQQEMQEVLISIAGDIAVSNGNYLTTGDDGFLTINNEREQAKICLPKGRGF